MRKRYAAMTVEDEVHGHAFVGVSLDSRLFTRRWVSHAIPALLARHESLLLLLADDLPLYTRSVRDAGSQIALDYNAATLLVDRRSAEFRRFLQMAAARLPPPLDQRVIVRTWAQFSDGAYGRLLRQLTIAFHVLEAFRRSIMHVVNTHVAKVPPDKRFRAFEQLSAHLVLDEIAMCLRVAEMDKYTFEYYPVNQVRTIQELYQGAFAEAGLTVETIVGHSPRRVFAMLKVPAQGDEAEVTLPPR